MQKAERLHQNHPTQPSPSREGNAFTLAEVLITLVIIGVIATITVPTLINKTNKQEYVSRLKKAYSTLSQATNLIIAEEGPPKNNWASDPIKIYDLYKKYLTYSRDCDNSTKCWGTGSYKYLNGNNYGALDNWDNYRKIVLNDGISVMFDQFSSSECTFYWEDGNPGSGCALIWVDVNGAKKPNIIGRDTFTFVVKEKGLYPVGCNSTWAYCSNSSNSLGCACKVLREGAMNY